MRNQSPEIYQQWKADAGLSDDQSLDALPAAKWVIRLFPTLGPDETNEAMKLPLSLDKACDMFYAVAAKSILGNLYQVCEQLTFKGLYLYAIAMPIHTWWFSRKMM